MREYRADTGSTSWASVRTQRSRLRIMCTWISKSNYPCTLKITLQQHWIYDIVWQCVPLHVLCSVCLCVCLCVRSVYQHPSRAQNINALSHSIHNPILVFHAVFTHTHTHTECVALLSSLKLSMFNRISAKEANELTEIKPQPFDWIFFLWEIVFSGLLVWNAIFFEPFSPFATCHLSFYFAFTVSNKTN